MSLSIIKSNWFAVRNSNKIHLIFKYLERNKIQDTFSIYDRLIFMQEHVDFLFSVYITTISCLIAGEEVLEISKYLLK